MASAAVLNFLGALVSIKVAATIAKGIVVQDEVTLKVIMAGLIGAITWNLLTWFFGLPSSSSHALIGGVAGSVLAAAGTDAVKWVGLKDKVLIPSLLAPVLGMIGAGLWSSSVRGCSRAGGPGSSTGCFAGCKYCLAASSPTPTERTMRRRRWAS